MGVGFHKCSGCHWDLCISLVPPAPCSSQGAKFPAVNKPASGSFLYILFFPPFFPTPAKTSSPYGQGWVGIFAVSMGIWLWSRRVLALGVWFGFFFGFFSLIPVTGAWWWHQAPFPAPASPSQGHRGDRRQPPPALGHLLNNVCNKLLPRGQLNP